MCVNELLLFHIKEVTVNMRKSGKVKELIIMVCVKMEKQIQSIPIKIYHGLSQDCVTIIMMKLRAMLLKF